MTRSTPTNPDTDRTTPLIRPLLPLLLLALPLAEIAVFVIVGSYIGVLATIGLVIATTIAGAVLLRIQGFGIVARIRAAMEAGTPPGRELVHGLMIMAAGVLLLAPGFITDTLGLLLFLPPVRDLAWRLLRDRIVVSGQQRRGASGTIDLDADDFTREEPRPRGRIDDLRDD